VQLELISSSSCNYTDTIVKSMIRTEWLRNKLYHWVSYRNPTNLELGNANKIFFLSLLVIVSRMTPSPSLISKMRNYGEGKFFCFVSNYLYLFNYVRYETLANVTNKLVSVLHRSSDVYSNKQKTKIINCSKFWNICFFFRLISFLQTNA